MRTSRRPSRPWSPCTWRAARPPSQAARLHRRLNEVGRDNLVAVPLLAQLVEVQLAQPDLAGATDTARSLAAVATQTGHLRTEAEAELALGSVLAAADDAAGARVHLDRALALFVRLRMPHAASRVHLALAADPGR